MDNYVICGVGNRLYNYWSQIAAILAEEGMSPYEQRECGSYQEAWGAYRAHLANCPVCSSTLRRVAAWAREVINAG